MADKKWVYHGTGTMYFTYIRNYGLTGKYPSKMYTDLMDIWINIKPHILFENGVLPDDYDSEIKYKPYRPEYSVKINFIELFFERQSTIKKRIQISLTGDYDTAVKYANSKTGGEGPYHIMELLDDNYDAIMQDRYIEQEMKDLMDQYLLMFGLRGKKQKGIVLTFDVNELVYSIDKFTQDQDMRNDYLQTLHSAIDRGEPIMIDFPIKPEYIYVVIDYDSKNYLPIQSPEVEQYILSLQRGGYRKSKTSKKYRKSMTSKHSKKYRKSKSSKTYKKYRKL
jgi:hypothetical protein